MHMGMLYEFEGKQIFKKHNLPLPPSKVVMSADEAVEAAKEMGLPVVIKAQTLSGKRGKRGLIKKVDSEEEVREKAAEILSKESDGRPIRKLLVEKVVPIKQEFYASVLVDGSHLSLLTMFSPEGGMDIEEIAATKPDRLAKISLPMNDHGFPFRFFEALKSQGFTGKPMAKLATILSRLFKIVQEEDLTLAEINPLVLTEDGQYLVLDAKVVVDDNATHRHPEWKEFTSLVERYTEEEIEAINAGISFVELHGDIGMIACGAGLGMATMDLIKYFGASPKNFLDVGGGASPEKVSKALEILTRDKEVKVILVNVFGGITRGDQVARGIIDAINKFNIDIPLVVRLIGTNQEEGVKILDEKGIPAYTEMEPAIKKAVELVKERTN